MKRQKPFLPHTGTRYQHNRKLICVSLANPLSSITSCRMEPCYVWRVKDEALRILGKGHKGWLAVHHKDTLNWNSNYYDQTKLTTRLYVCTFGAATGAELELQRNTDREITPALFTNTPLQSPLPSPPFYVFMISKPIPHNGNSIRGGKHWTRTVFSKKNIEFFRFFCLYSRVCVCVCVCVCVNVCNGRTTAGLINLFTCNWISVIWGSCL
jgi:hypothetical protein